MPTRKKTAPKTVAPKTARAAKTVMLTHDAIALAAYLRFEARGMCDGHDVDDWLAAEETLTAERRGKP